MSASAFLNVSMRYWYALHVSGCWNRNDPNWQVILEFKENNDGGGGVDSGEMDNHHAEDDSEEEEEVDNEFFLRPRLIILDVLDWDDDDEETPEALDQLNDFVSNLDVISTWQKATKDLSEVGALARRHGGTSLLRGPAWLLWHCWLNFPLNVQQTACHYNY